ncbi:MAG: hypothetical protein KGH53_00105 [Candidatus Micrarchaeota archaeon]|nr:hypothetical protein [Candidatus Micrarchaeota archaeon]
MQKAPLLILLLVLFQSIHLVGAQTYSYYVDDLGLTFFQNSTVVGYNVTATAQTDGSGYGPGYFVQGFSDTGFWYQEGIGFDWLGGTGFNFMYSMFAPDGTLLAWSGNNYRFTGTVYPNDKVVLYMYFSNPNVILIAKDLNTSAYATVKLSNRGAVRFLGNPYRTSYGSSGYFTGLMTEWIHPSLYYSQMQTVTYSPYSTSLSNSTARLWIYDAQMTYGIAQATVPKTLSNFTSGPVLPSDQNIIRSGNLGEKYYLDNFYTGNVSSSTLRIKNAQIQGITTDYGLNCAMNVSLSVEGGKFPYNYSVILDNSSINSSLTNSPTFNFKTNCNGIQVGTHYYYVKVVDGAKNKTITPVQFIKINNPPQLLAYSASTSNSFFYLNDTQKISAIIQNGTPPYSYTLYVNNQLKFKTSSSNFTVHLDNNLKNQVKVLMQDSAGFTMPQMQSVHTDYDYLHLLFVIILLLLILLILYLRWYLYNRDEYYYSHEQRREKESLLLEKEKPVERNQIIDASSDAPQNFLDDEGDSTQNIGSEKADFEASKESFSQDEVQEQSSDFNSDTQVQNNQDRETEESEPFVQEEKGNIESDAPIEKMVKGDSSLSTENGELNENTAPSSEQNVLSEDKLDSIAYAPSDNIVENLPVESDTQDEKLNKSDAESVELKSEKVEEAPEAAAPKKKIYRPRKKNKEGTTFTTRRKSKDQSPTD